MHFLKRDELYGGIRTSKPWAAVQVRIERGSPRTLTIQPGVSVLKVDVMLIPLPENVRVVDGDGNAVVASHRFWVTTESFDPFHLLLDAPVVGGLI